MKLSRITAIPGILTFLLLVGGCASFPQFGGTGSGDNADQAGTPAVAADPSTQRDDLWRRLRGNFRLANLERDQRRLHHYEKWYAARPAYFERITERAHWFLPYVLDEVEKRGMPGEIALLPAIESAFRPDAVSRSQAVGLWQFIPSTGIYYGLPQNWWTDGRRDLIQSTRAALDYLDFLQKEFDGDWELALASYNAGEGTVRRQVKYNRSRNRPTNYQSLKLRRETTDYVPKLLAVRNIIANPKKYGITLNSIPNRPTLAVVDARSQIDLTVAASLSKVSYKQLRYFNQGYKRGATPPDGPHTLVVPVEHAAELSAALKKLSTTQRLQWARHEVRQGDNLGRIAHKYGVSVKSIVNANQLPSTLIHPRQELRIPLSAGNRQYAKAKSVATAGETASGDTATKDTAENTAAGDNDVVHKVLPGDSLWGISRRYDVSIAELIRWNQIARNALLHPGQFLVVSR